MTDSAHNQSRPPRRAGPARARALAQKDAAHQDSDANRSVTAWLKGAHEAIALRPQWLQVPRVTVFSGDFLTMLPRTDFIPGECLCFCLLSFVVSVGLLLYTDSSAVYCRAIFFGHLPNHEKIRCSVDVLRVLSWGTDGL